MNNEKMIKNSNVIDKLIKVFEVITLVGCILIVAFMILFPIIGSEKLLDTNSFLLGDISVKLKNSSSNSLSSTKLITELIFASVLAVLAVCWYGLRMFRKVLEPLKNGRPFDGSSSKNIRKLGVFVIIAGVIVNIFETVSNYMVYKLCDINNVFNTDVVSFSLDSNFDFWFIIIACILFLLAHVFSYGEELQTESDETL